MISTLFGFKIGQTQTFTEEGKRIPVTTIAVDPCIVTQSKPSGATYAYQLAVGTAKKASKPVEGLMKKAGVDKKPRFLREVRVEKQDESIVVGASITASEVFTAGDKVTITGISKGKGFAGVMKRHGFHGGPKTHGQSDRWRSPGSIGSGTTPGRVYKGKRMAGRMGTDQITIKGLVVVAVDAEKNIVTVKGLIPGFKTGLVKIVKQA